MLSSDTLCLIVLIAIVASAKPIVDRMVALGEGDPDRMCAECQARRQSYPLLAAALMPRCTTPTCSAHPSQKGHRS